MEHWTPEQAVFDPDVPDEVIEILERLEAEFDELNGEWPRVASVGMSDGVGDDSWRYEVVVELAHGVALPAEAGYGELIDRYGGDEPTVDDVVGDVMEGVLACMVGPLPHIGRVLHDARLRSRRIVADWTREGLQARVVDVRLAPHREWRGDADPHVRVLVETLDDGLAPAVEIVPAESLDGLPEAMEAAKATLAFRQGRRAELGAAGASGEIDCLALKAVAMTARREGVLRRFAAERRVHLADGTTLTLIEGRVSLGTPIDAGHVHILGDTVSIDAAAVDPAALKRAVGRPVTDLVRHHYLTEEAVVTRVERSQLDGRERIDLTVDAPRSLFCSASGRCWAPGPAAAAGPNPADGGARPNVVPFRRRA